MPAIQIKSVSKSFGEKIIFKSLNMEFPEKGIVCVMGASGFGKTTLLRLIAALDSPDSGEINFYIHGNKIKCPAISVVFQETRLFEWLTVKENCTVVMDKHKNTSYADEILEKLYLSNEKDKYPSQLSGGMRQRVSIARALCHGGNIFLLDEPFKGLDFSLRESVMNTLVENINPEKNEGLCIIVTHDIREAVKIADTIFVFNDTDEFKIVNIDIPRQTRDVNSIIEKNFSISF